VGIKKEYEEAAKTLGANAFQTFREVTFPLLLPAILAGALFAFTISFDDITATLFWATAQNQTVPVKIFSMLRNSISPEINALGAVMIVLTVTTPLLAGYLSRKFSKIKGLGPKSDNHQLKGATMAIVTQEKLDRVYDAYKTANSAGVTFSNTSGLAGASIGLIGSPFTNAVKEAWAAKSIRFDGWGGVVSEAFSKHAFKPFTKATGIEVIDGEFGDMNSYLTRVKASYPPGGEFNIAHLSAVFDYARYAELGFASVLDESKIPNLKNVMASMIKPLREITKGTLSAVPYDLGQTGIAYNTKHISKEKAEKLGASLLWDKELKGKLGSWEGDFQDQHVVRGPAHRSEPQQHDRSRGHLGGPARTARPDEKILGLRRRVDEPAGQRRDLCHGGLVRAGGGLQQEGHPIGYLSPKGTYSWMEYLFVLKGTDLDVAQQLLNFMLEPAAAIAVAEGQNYPPSLDPTKVELTEKIKKMPAFDPTGKLDGVPVRQSILLECQSVGMDGEVG
jgi:spermidine/putrescine transport system substrate-binding protein